MILAPTFRRALFATVAEPLKKKLWRLLKAASLRLTTYQGTQALALVVGVVKTQYWTYWLFVTVNHPADRPIKITI